MTSRRFLSDAGSILLQLHEIFMCSYFEVADVLSEIAFHTCLEVAASLITLVRTNWSYLVNHVPHIWLPTRKIPYCFIPRGDPWCQCLRRDYALLCTGKMVPSYWLRDRFLRDTCRPFISFDPQDVRPQSVFSFFAKYSFLVLCEVFLPPALFEEVTPGALCWYDISHWPSLCTLD